MKEFLNFLSIEFSNELDNKNYFVKDTNNFLRLQPINAFHILGMESSEILKNMDNIYPFKFSNGKDTEKYLSLEKKKSKTTIDGYYLDYNPNVKSKSDIKHLSIPKENPLVNYMFTGGLSGCLIVVENAGDNYNVYHDPRLGSKSYQEIIKEYENVIAVFGKPEDVDYNNSGIMTPLGFAVMIYDENSGWLLYGQALKYGEIDKKKGTQPVMFNEEKILATINLSDLPMTLKNTDGDSSPEQEIIIPSVPIEHLIQSMSKLFNNTNLDLNVEENLDQKNTTQEGVVDPVIKNI